MPLPDQTPKLPKLPFLVADAALLAAAWMISDQARHPLASDTLLAVVACVGGAGVLGAIPFLTDYARKQDEALDERQRGLEALSRTVATSAEQISIAAHGIQEIAELAQKNLSAAEALTRKGSPPPAPGAREGRGEKTAERLEAAAEKIAQAAADLARAEAALQKRIAAAGREREKPRSAPEPLRPDPVPAPGPPPEPSAPAAEAPAPEPEPRAESPAEPVPAEAPVAPESASAPEAPSAEAPPRRPRAPRKPKPEPAPEAEPAAEPVQEELAPEFSQLAPEEAAPIAAVSADGATRLLVTAYIGIGNRLFIRGEGPGLSWDAGVPLQFVSIGKWRWESAEASGPVSFKLYKNDQIECSSLGERTLEPGQQLEVAASF